MLSFKELKFRMSRFAEERGITNELRAHLRYRFSEALRLGPQSKRLPSGSLSKQIADRIIREYLLHEGYHYTLSTFAGESGQREHTVQRDVLALLHLPESTLTVLQTMVEERMRGEAPGGVPALPPRTELLRASREAEPPRTEDAGRRPGDRREGSPGGSVARTENASRSDGGSSCRKTSTSSVPCGFLLLERARRSIGHLRLRAERLDLVAREAGVTADRGARRRSSFGSPAFDRSQ